MLDVNVEELLIEARILVQAGPVLTKIIANRRKNTFEKLLMEYRKGSTNYHHLVSELSVLSSIEREILEKQQILDSLDKEKK